MTAEARPNTEQPSAEQAFLLGSIGFRSLSALIQEDVMSGMTAASSMMVIAFSLVIGLLSNLTAPPREYS